MLNYIIRRLLLMFPTLLGITALVFFCMALAPGGIGGPALDQSGDMDTERAAQVRAYYEKRYGIDKPVIVQYGRWLNQISPIGFKIKEDGSLGRLAIKAPSLGESMSRHRPVADLIRETLPITLLLNLITIPIIYSIGIISGIYAARHRGKLYDVGTGTAFLALWSIPSMWAGVMLIGLLANRQYIKIFPTGGLQGIFASEMPFLPRWTETGFVHGYLLDVLWHLVLPIVCLSYGGFAFLSKLTRASILENLNADYVRTARAKGVTNNVILFRHVFRNSLLALITVVASILPAMLAGSVVIETIFNLPGMGQLAVHAVQYRDREVVLAMTLISGLLGLTSQIVRDIWYAVADPRVSYE
jgi:ABC-type dipeptide/oligopeptide/nickel transport system permease component